MGDQIGSHPLTKNHTSDVHIPDDWYIVCRSTELRRQPRSYTLLGVPIVLFRDTSGKVTALLDRCPHRNVPLSLGTLQEDLLQCAYHGWCFDTGGMCRRIPALTGDAEGKGRRVQRYPAQEGDGFVWVYATPDAIPVRDRYAFPFTSDRRYLTLRKEFLVRGSVHAVAENALDVPHTAFLHGGLFRPKGGSGNEIDVTVRVLFDRAEAEYRGEPRPSGIAGLLLAPRGGTVEHTDRFILPSVAQVEYRLGEATHFCVSSFLTPVHDQLTRLFAVVTLRLPFPAKLVAPVVRPLFMSIFRQDARMLRHQAETIGQFGGEQFCSTEIDLLGPRILRLLRQAERGERDSGQKERVHTVRMII